MKVIAFYLPQFHEIPENNEWWGKGFTEWVNVKKAESLFEGHIQPRIPLNNNYYNLLDNDVLHWQVNLANQYGVYGFCFYHYWFDGHMLLEKPVEMYLNDKSLKKQFCLCWANEHWTNAWVSGKNKVLIEQRYGNKKEWKEHFDYLLPFFKDDRYIKENNKPLFVIYRPEIIECLNPMLDLWNELAKKEGFDGLCFAYQHIDFDLKKKKDDSRFTYDIEYQPTYAQTLIRQQRFLILRKMKRKVAFLAEKYLKLDLRYIHNNSLIKFNYDEIWKYIINMKPVSKKSIPGAYVNWDNTPRRGDKGIVHTDVTPEKFEQYFIKQIEHARNVYHSDKIFIFAWNEWAEGGFLEPDEQWKYGMLEAIRNALVKTNEFEE